MATEKKTISKKTVKKTTPVTKATVRTAVLAINTMQYVVKEGETIATRISLDSTEKDVDVKLLAILDGDKLEYGKPYLENKIDYKLGEQVTGEKVVTRKFKAKARYRKKSGFRPKYIEFTLNSVK